MAKSLNWPLLMRTMFAVCLAQALLVHAQQPVAVPPTNNVAAAPVSYPDSVGGLEHFGKDLLDALKHNDSARATSLAQSITLPDAAAWYHETYGDYSGKEDVRAYDHDRPQLPFKVVNLFKKAIAEGTTGIHVKRYDRGCDDNDGENTFPLLEYRTHETPLYDLRLYSGAKYFRLWPMAYVDGTFRYVGEPEPWQFPATDGSVRISLKNMAAKVVKQVKPTYSDRARGERLGGTVQMHALIGTDGSIEKLRVTKGYCSLAKESVAAVRQWRYAPTLVQGKPVEVDTTIEAIYAIRGN